MCRLCGCSPVVDHDHAHAHAHAHGHAHGHDHEHDHPHAHAPPHGPGHPDHHVASRSARTLSIEAALLAKNDRLAKELRAQFAERQIIAFNLIGSPGAGKTTLLEYTIRALPGLAISVVEGDQATDHDARRIAETGCQVVQINTDAGCHLDATMMDQGLGQLEPAPHSLVFIENVGNLVCPALFDLGEHAKVVVMSVTEGEDKPLKYPHVFRAARALVLTKVDLLPHLEFDVAACIANAHRVNPQLEVFPIAAFRGLGLGDWCGWLRAQLGGRA